MVTYRPLFVGVSLHFFKVSSIFSRPHSNDKGTDRSGTSSSSNGYSQDPWAEKTIFDPRIPQLSAKAASKGLHVVNIEIGATTKPLLKLSSKQVQEYAQGLSEPPKSSYRSLPFMTKKQDRVVDRFV